VSSKPASSTHIHRHWIPEHGVLMHLDPTSLPPLDQPWSGYSATSVGVLVWRILLRKSDMLLRHLPKYHLIHAVFFQTSTNCTAGPTHAMRPINSCRSPMDGQSGYLQSREQENGSVGKDSPYIMVSDQDFDNSAGVISGNTSIVQRFAPLALQTSFVDSDGNHILAVSAFDPETMATMKSPPDLINLDIAAITKTKARATVERADNVILRDDPEAKAAFLATFTPEDEKAIMRKVDKRFLVLIGLMYMIKQVLSKQ